MVLKIGGWFELECTKSYVYARIGQREAMLNQFGRRYALRAGAYAGLAPRATFRVVI